jgi:hypothetical protein
VASVASVQHPVEIGPYKVLGPIGQGGMGVVYRAEHKDSHARVAVKTVRVKHESLLSGIRREIRALMRVNHPGVVRIVGEGVVEGVPWYAMELLEGQTLRDHGKSIWSNIAGSDTFEGPTMTNPARRANVSTEPMEPAVAAVAHRARAQPAAARRRREIEGGAGADPSAL